MIHVLVFLCALATFADSNISKAEKEVTAVMGAWRQAMVARDRAILEKLYAPDLTYTHSNGRQENKAEAINAVVNGKDRIEFIEIQDSSIRVHGSTALVKAKTILQMNSGGTKSTIHLDVLYVWMKNPSGWQLVARQAIRLNP